MSVLDPSESGVVQIPSLAVHAYELTVRNAVDVVAPGNDILLVDPLRPPAQAAHAVLDGSGVQALVIIDEAEIPELRQAIRACPGLHRLLKQLV
jgi:hypothetical protein